VYFHLIPAIYSKYEIRPDARIERLEQVVEQLNRWLVQVALALAALAAAGFLALRRRA
jgi:hypothetical protein